MEELLAQFPTIDHPNGQAYRSFIYQPERISLNSRQSLQQPGLQVSPQYLTDYYSTFDCELRSPLLRAKSIELLRATIPNAVTSIPNSETAFYYYRIPTLGAPNFEPDYSQLTPANIRMVRLLSSFVYTPDNYINPDAYGFNKTFEDYQDLVTELNKAATNDPNQLSLSPNYYIPGDITFTYNATLNKIVVQGNNYENPPGTPQFYYLPVGYQDPNLFTFIDNIRSLGGLSEISFPTNGSYTLNRRLGFLWNGIFAPNPPDGSLEYAGLVNRTFPRPDYVDGEVWVPLIYYTAEGYADLVYSANLFLFCDILGGSTQDNLIDDRLLSVIPMATPNLGVGFPENKISCPLTKISENIFQIKFSMRTDTGEPFWIPRNAYINLELKICY
jgi:hypothetical protein